MKPGITRQLLLLLLCGSIVLLSCSKGSSPYGGTNNNSNNNTSTSTSNSISLSGNAFSPSSLTVKTGTTVTWTNNDYTTHTVTSSNGNISSGDMKYGDTYSYTFSTAGTFAYHCAYHSGMTGSIVVSQ